MPKFNLDYSDKEIETLYAAAEEQIKLPTFWDAEVIDIDNGWVLAFVDSPNRVGRVLVTLPVDDVYFAPQGEFMIHPGYMGVLVCSQYAAEDAGLL